MEVRRLIEKLSKIGKEMPVKVCFPLYYYDIENQMNKLAGFQIESLLGVKERADNCSLYVTPHKNVALCHWEDFLNILKNNEKE